MEWVVETARGSIRILGRNKVTMRAKEVEFEQEKVLEKGDKEEANETRTALRACQTINVRPIAPVLVMGQCTLPGLVKT